MKFADTHAHLSDSAFEKDRKEVIEKSFSAGVCRIVEISCGAKDWPKAESLSMEFREKIFSVFGLHPEAAGTEGPGDIEKLKGYLKKDFCAGIGEIGLDYYWEPQKKEEQMKLLDEMLNISNELAAPAVFHVRNPKDPSEGNAYADLLKILKSKWTFENKKRKRGVLHCFSGTYEDAKAALDLGLFLGVNGTFTYKRNMGLRETVGKVGIENVLIETDCPYLPPEGRRGKRNDPSNIPVIAQALSVRLNMSLGRVAEITFQNAEIFFEK